MFKVLSALFVGVFVTAITAFGQTEWTSYYQDKSLVIEYRYNDCNRPADGIYKQEIYLRFSNKTTSQLVVNYQKKLSYNNKPVANTGPENTFALTLKPGEVLEGSCGLKDKRLYIFVKMLDGTSQSVLTAFELVNIKY